MKNELWYRLQSVTSAILTELPKPSSSNIHVSTSERVNDEQRAKAKTDSNVLTIRTPVGFAGKAKANTLAAKNFGVSAHYANLTSVEDYDYYDEDMNESANAPGRDDGEQALDYDDDEEKDTFSSNVALDDVTVFGAVELDAIALLGDTWNDDLDPEVSAQLVQSSAQAYFSFGKDKGKGKGKAKGKGKGRYPVRPSHLSSETFDDD